MILKLWHFIVAVANDSFEVSKNLIFSYIEGLISWNPFKWFTYYFLNIRCEEPLCITKDCDSEIMVTVLENELANRYAKKQLKKQQN